MDLLYKLLEEFEIEYCPDKIVKPIYDENDILRQIDILCKFHKSTGNIKGEYLLVLDSNLGKRLQKLKIQERRNERYFNELKVKGAEDKFEKILLENCSGLFSQAKRSLDQAEDKGQYISLIFRSMNRNELSIGDGSSENLFYSNGVKVKNIKKISLDMVEWDLINFLFKVKRKNIKFDLDNAIKTFVTCEGLDQKSEEFIKAILEYPLDFMRLCEKRRQNKKSWTNQQYENKLYMCINKIKS